MVANSHREGARHGNDHAVLHGSIFFVVDKVFLADGHFCLFNGFGDRAVKGEIDRAAFVVHAHKVGAVDGDHAAVSAGLEFAVVDRIIGRHGDAGLGEHFFRNGFGRVCGGNMFSVVKVNVVVGVVACGGVNGAPHERDDQHGGEHTLEYAGNRKTVPFLL